MWDRRLSRRNLLATGGSVLLGQLLGCADRARETAPHNEGVALPARGEIAGPVRIGAVLPPPGGVRGTETPLGAAVAEAARLGTEMAAEEHHFNAEILGVELEVLITTAGDGDSARAAAARLIEADGVIGLIGGYSAEQALALGRLAGEREVLFLNVGSPDDALRHEACGRFTFHVEPSAAMYLDAIAGWFVRSGFRRWFFVHQAGTGGDALYSRARRSLTERHFGARAVGSVAVSPGAREFDSTFAAIRRARPDVVLLLLEAEAQLAFLRLFEEQDGDALVTGFPDPATQTRAFYESSRAAAPDAGTGFRAAAWEASLDAYGARELNARFRARSGGPMDPPAWTAYQGVKILVEAALQRGTLDAPELVRHLESDRTVFDVWKGIGVSFRPWDHQLRQSLYLVEVRSAAADPDGDLAMLVGELPAIYMPGTDPVERLDQLGDLRGRSRCRFR